MSTQNTLSSLEALEMFREHCAELSSVEKITAISESQFVEQYATDFFKGDKRKARQAYREAYRIKDLIVLLWANIKDTIASPHLQETLFNNIPKEFIDHQQSIPGYDRLFGNLDFIECDLCRSIFGPAAYFVDLLRFIEKHIPQDELQNEDKKDLLKERQPRLFRIPLDCENTYNLIPYIDLVNEVLEDIVRTNDKPNPYQVVEEASFPMQLPFHLPLEEIRTYLKQLKVSLQEIYELFGVTEPDITRELLALSPQEYQLVKDPITVKEELDKYYDMDVTSRGKGSLEDVDVFTEQTGLSYKELSELLFLDLSSNEVQAGLSRLFFINNTGDQQGHLYIEENIERRLFDINDNIAEIITKLNNHEFTEELKDKFSDNDVTLSEEEIKVLVDSKDQKWQIWDSQKKLTYIIRCHDDKKQLTIYEEPYDRLANLTLSKLDRIYRFLKLCRKLGWSFADLDWALRSLQGAHAGEKVLRFDGVNDFISISIPEAKNLNPETFTLETWVLPSLAGTHPIFAKGTTDSSFTRNRLAPYSVYLTLEGLPAGGGLVILSYQ